MTKDPLVQEPGGSLVIAAAHAGTALSSDGILKATVEVFGFGECEIIEEI